MFMAAQPKVEDRIAESTLHLLRTGGPRSVTVEAVTAHSGIAKTTIYRRHRDRREMFSAALSPLATLTPLSLDADPRERLRWLIRHAIEAIDDGIGFGGFASLLTEEDPEFSTLFRQILVDHRAKLVNVIDACKADGSMRGDVDPETLIDAIVGAYIAERARDGQVGEDWEGRLFALFWPAVST
jgi:AcrR family transcriptional regulator